MLLLVTVGVVTAVPRKKFGIPETGKTNSRSGAGDDGDLVLETETGSGHCDQIVLNNGVEGDKSGMKTMLTRLEDIQIGRWGLGHTLRTSTCNRQRRHVNKSGHDRPAGQGCPGEIRQMTRATVGYGGMHGPGSF